MIIGFAEPPSHSLSLYLGAALGEETVIVESVRDNSGQWMAPPAVVVVQSGSELGVEQMLALAHAGVHVVLATENESLVPSTVKDVASIVTVSCGASTAVSARDLQFSRTGSSCEVRVNGGAFALQIRDLGERAILEALVALAVAGAAGVSGPHAAERLAHVVASEPWQLQLLQRADGVTVVNDGYEANPTSMAAALKMLTLMTYGTSRAVAVLGEMTVDDVDSRDEHDRIGRLIVRLNVGKLIVVGYGARHIHNAAGLEGSWDGESVLVDNVEEAYDLVNKELRGGDVVLVKSSKLAGLGILGDRLGGKTT
jgi:UDP-N-acetylmuramoyl-tripeptide--D-alanyl-D-alanine ligase